MPTTNVTQKTNLDEDPQPDPTVYFNPKSRIDNTFIPNCCDLLFFF